MATPALTEIKVQKGATFIGIVKKNGFDSKKWRSFYEASYNKDFRKKRPDPNTILPGDIIRLPTYRPDEVAAIRHAIDVSLMKLDEATHRAKTAKVRVSELKKELESKQPTTSKIKKKIEAAQKEVDRLYQLATDAGNVCKDMYSCMGGGAASQKFSNEAKRYKASIRELSADLDKAKLEDAKAKLKIMQKIKSAEKQVIGLLKEQLAFQKEVDALIKTYESATAAY